MIHGHYFNFLDKPELQSLSHVSSHKNITVHILSNPDILKTYTILRPWVPLSGQEGRYFAQTPFEEADETFSWGLEIKDLLTLLWEPKEKLHS